MVAFYIIYRALHLQQGATLTIDTEQKFQSKWSIIFNLQIIFV